MKSNKYCIIIINSPKKFGSISLSHFNNGQKFGCDKRSQNYLFWLLLAKRFKNLNLEIKFIIKSNESLAENQIKSETEQLSPKYKHRKNICEHGR